MRLVGIRHDEKMGLPINRLEPDALLRRTSLILNDRHTPAGIGREAWPKVSSLANLKRSG